MLRQRGLIGGLIERCRTAVVLVRQGSRQVPATLRGRVDGLLIASNQMKVAPALAGVNPIHAGDRLLAAPVAAFVALAALLGCRFGAPHPAGYIETGACQHDANVNTQARHDHPPRFGAVTSRMTMVLLDANGVATIAV